MENNPQAGMSLVDVMVGVFVGLVLIGAVLSIVVHQGRMRQANSETGLAMNAVINTVEQFRSLPESQMVGLNGSGFDVPGSNGQPGGLAAQPGDPDGLPGEILVTPITSAGGVKIYELVASVLWSGVTGRRKYTFTTLITERR